MKQLILFWIVLTHMTQIYGKEIEYFPSMPMPTQYNKLEHYHSALHAWEKVAKNVMICNPSKLAFLTMPLPTQYAHPHLYRQALEIWEAVHQVVKKECAEKNTDVMPMPMPTQYQDIKLYQQALTVWERVYTHSTTCQVQLPPLPKPTQYVHLDLYQQALKSWEQAGSCQELD